MTPASLAPTPTPTMTTLPLFLTFDSHLKASDLLSPNRSALAMQQTFVWGATADAAKLKAWRKVAPTVKLSYYMPYSRAPSASKGFGLDYWLREHPDWVLYRCDRKTVAFWNGESAPHGSVPLDFTNPDVIEWQVLNQSKFAARNGYDALAADNYGGGARAGASPGQACGVWLRTTNGTTEWAYRFNQSGSSFDNARSQPAMRNASIVWLERFRELMGRLISPSFGLVPNLCIDQPSTSRIPHDWAKSADAERVLKASTAVLSERGFTGWGSKHASEAELLNEYAWMERLAHAGKAYYSINEVKGGANDSWAEWVIGAFLVGMQDGGGGGRGGGGRRGGLSLSALWLGGVQDYGGWSDSSAGLSAPIGDALGPRWKLDPSNGVWLRNFSGGLALINPRSAADDDPLRGGGPVMVHVGHGESHGGWRNLTGGASTRIDPRTGSLALMPASARVLLFGSSG